MKTLFIPTKRKISLDENLLAKISKKLPSNIYLSYSIQFQDVAKRVKEVLEKDHKITGFSQILGCTIPKMQKGTEAALLVGSGKFHAVSLAYESKLPVFIFEPNYLEKISEFDVWEFEKKKKGAYAKFLISNKIGIIISTKPGQEKLSFALRSKKSLKNKKPYLFITNEITPAEFENFSDIESWVNTSCPRMDMADSRIVNIKEILRH
ncbi:2-(3-amino-3-carboxypropyl)histidine synthase [uncultured archaeon]|nr:2-(3-amino-3-carboxypropyl)histidine synthase [uncultured archaeon]